MTAFTSTIQKMYVAFFNRPADYNGLANWEAFAVGKTVAQLTTAISVEFAKSAEYTIVFAGLSNSQIVTRVYQNLLNREPDPSGLKNWVDHLVAGRSTVSSLVTDILRDAGAGDIDTINNKVAASQKFSDALDTVAKINAYSGAAANQIATAWLSTVGETAASLTAATSTATLAALTANLLDNAGGTAVLTNGTDILTSSTFTSGLVYNPAGTDRINALQSEDVLSGAQTGPNANNKLNAVLGNANDNGAQSVTPTLKNIQTINLEITGNTKTLDVRFADSIKNIAINKLTAEAASTVTVDNIGQPAANLSIKNSALVGNTINFNYVEGVLAGRTATANGETGNLSIASVNADKIHIGSENGATDREGFENLNLNSTGTNKIKVLEAVDLENLKITGSGALDVLTTAQDIDRVKFTAGAIAIGDGLGIRTVDASGFNGTTNLDITKALGGHADPANSGAKYYATITGGAGSDTFWTSAAVAAESATLKDTINGGEGSDTLKLIDASIARFTDAAKSLPTVTGVETLELRMQGVAAQQANMVAFDSALATVNLRNEQVTGAAAPVAGTFTLREVGKTVAEHSLNLLHASGAGAGGVNGAKTNVVDTVVVRLADASATNDLVALTVKSDLNTSSTYDYKINLEVEQDAAAKYKGVVESLTINDQDDETNTVTIESGNDAKGATLAATGLTNTVTLTGGTSTKDYTVTSTLIAATVDASTQKSNLRLSVGEANQTIKLGTGNDILTFETIDTFNGLDTITDAGGTDTVRAAFSKDVTGTPALTGIEKLHIVATNNVAIDMSKATTVAELAILSDKAVDRTTNDASPATAEPFGITTGVDASDIITLNNTALATLNFFGDNDTDDVANNENLAHIFNGVTLANNTGATLAVNINSSLDADKGATSYTTGQLTTHGVSTMNIIVGNELAIATGATASATTTTIGNIWDRDLVTFTASANGSMALGTVSGNATGSNIKTFDVSAVKGNFSADIVALGDGAVVTLAAGKNTVNALGSSGKGVTITSFAAADTIVGTAQSDFIRSGAGDDTVDGDRGDNVIEAGAGNDNVTAKDGNNTVAFGSGTWETAAINFNTKLDGSKATNVFTLAGTTALVTLDTNGDNTADVTQVLAVGAGSELRVDWTGSVLNEATALLDGSKSITTAAATYNGDASANLVIAGAGEATTFNGGAGNDVLIKTNAEAVTFNGGAGNDTFVGNKTVANTVAGGAGADVIVLASDGTKVADATATKVSIADGDSTAVATDMVYGFNTAAAATNSLDLVFTTIATATAGTNGTDAGTGALAVKSHAIANGIVTFDTVDTFAAAKAIGSAAATQLSLANVLSYLAVNLNNTGATVGFAYDGNGDGDTVDAVDSFYVFQDGAIDTVVQLVGVQFANGANVAAIAAAAGANTVVIS